jgi:hypothetical protein
VFIPLHGPGLFVPRQRLLHSRKQLLEVRGLYFERPTAGGFIQPAALENNLFLGQGANDMGANGPFKLGQELFIFQLVQPMCHKI